MILLNFFLKILMSMISLSLSFYNSSLSLSFNFLLESRFSLSLSLKHKSFLLALLTDSSLLDQRILIKQQLINYILKITHRKVKTNLIVI